MGDEDAYDLGKCNIKQAQAMAKLIGMNAAIMTDDSGYYEVPLTLEESLRKKVPALKNAWDQYQIILRFAKEEHYVINT